MNTKTPKQPPPLPPGCDALLGKAQLCFALDISIRSLQSMLSAGEFPPPDTRLGVCPKWRVGTLNAWIAERCKKKG